MKSLPSPKEKELHPRTNDILVAWKKHFKDTRIEQRKVEAQTKTERESPTNLDNWTKKGKPYSLLLSNDAVTENTYWIAFYDCAYGHVCAYNKFSQELQVHKNGIFLDNWCILGDYYGYSDRPAIFKRDA